MSTSPTDLQLFSYYRSSCSYRVRIALAHKNLPIQYHAVHLVKDGGEQLSPQYLARNPQGEVPYFIHGDFGLSQSMAILEYLDEVFPEPRLFWGQVHQRARIRQICEAVNSGIQPIQNLKVLKSLTQEFGATDEQKTKWAHHWITVGFAALEKLLELTHGSYCMGDRISAADCFLVPQVYNARRFAVDLSQFPIISSIDANCALLPNFALAHPDRQPDSP